MDILWIYAKDFKPFDILKVCYRGKYPNENSEVILMRRKLLLVLIVALAMAATIAVPPAAGTQIKNLAGGTTSTTRALKERYSQTR